MPFSQATLKQLDNFSKKLLQWLDIGDYERASGLAARFVQDHTSMSFKDGAFFKGSPDDIATTVDFDTDLDAYWAYFPPEQEALRLIPRPAFDALRNLLWRLPAFALGLQFRRSRHMDEMWELVQEYLVHRRLRPDRPPKQRHRIPVRRGRPTDAVAAARNEVIRKIHRKMRVKNSWAELARLANADERIRDLGVPRISRDVARNVTNPPRKRARGSKSRN